MNEPSPAPSAPTDPSSFPDRVNGMHRNVFILPGHAQCATCGSEFRPAVAWQHYCTRKCAKKAEITRRKARDKAQENANMAQSAPNVIVDPSAEVLNAWAAVVSVSGGKVVQPFKGTLPEGWTSPAGVVMTGQNGGWMMQHAGEDEVQRMLDAAMAGGKVV